MMTAALVMAWISYRNIFPYLVHKKHETHRISGKSADFFQTQFHFNRIYISTENDIHSLLIDDQPFYKTGSGSLSSE
jgi:hypothetical protein